MEDIKITWQGQDGVRSTLLVEESLQEVQLEADPEQVRQLGAHFIQFYWFSGS